MAEKTEVNYDQLETLAKQFEGEAQVIESVRKFLSSESEQLHGGGWVGQGADKFQAEMSGEVIPAVQRLSEALTQAANTMKLICNIFNEAEQETQGYFKSLGE
jgi:WXG100 family type VII secretion target